MGRLVLGELGHVDLLVNAAGTNTPRRSLEVLEPGEYRRLIDTNLNGAYWCVQAFLPAMRTRGRGTIVNVISDAARQASPKAGPAYSASKFGLLGLTQAINAEERARGIRACALLPGTSTPPCSTNGPRPRRPRRAPACCARRTSRRASGSWLNCRPGGRRGVARPAGVIPRDPSRGPLVA